MTFSGLGEVGISRDGLIVWSKIAYIPNQTLNDITEIMEIIDKQKG